MGFTACLYSYPKYKDSTPEDIFGVETYISYEENNWAKNNFTSPEEFCKYNNLKVPSKDFIDYYSLHCFKDEFNYLTIKKTLGAWCSNGIWLYNILKTIKPNSNEDTNIILTKDDCFELLYKVFDFIKESNLQQVSISNSFSVKSKDDDGPAEILVTSCDGIEVEFEDTSIKRIFTAKEYEENFITIKNDLYSDYFLSIIDTISILLDIIKYVDFENTVVFYTGGW